MSPIASATSGLEMSAARPAPLARATALPVVTPEPARVQPAPLPAVEDPARDARFDNTANTVHAVRQVVQQITASLAYGAHVSVVSNGTSIHATIDVSA